jgi:hypothetical protein
VDEFPGFIAPSFAMKTKNIHRDIGSRHARVAGDSRGLGRVLRMRDRYMSTDRSRKSRGDPAEEPANRSTMIVVWSVMLSLATLAVVGGFMMLWMRSHKNVKSGPTALHSEADVRIVSRFVSPGEDFALDLVKQALVNRDPAKVETFFRLGGASPAEVMEFIEGSVARDGRLESCEWLSSMDVEGLLLEGVLVTYAGKGQPVERLAFLTPDDRGVWKVDYDAFARSSRPSWKDFLERREDHAQVRVVVARDYYFNTVFQNDSQWACFAIISPEAEELYPGDPYLLFGYCKLGSSQAAAMERLLADGLQSCRATLEIGRTTGANVRQFEITRVLAQDWVLAARPFDEKFD